jgi:hypothetical protein
MIYYLAKEGIKLIPLLDAEEPEMPQMTETMHPNEFLILIVLK